LDETAAASYGRDFAILAGDVQQAWAMDLMLRTADSNVSLKTVHALARRMQTFLNRGLISGEALDVEFACRPEPPSKGEAAHMIDGKTGVLLSFSASAGAMIGLDTPDHMAPEVNALSEYARKIGYAFQLCDDLLGVYGSSKTFGKPLCSDFREGKPTVLALEAYARLAPGDVEKLQSLKGKEPAESDIQMVRDLLDSRGAKDAVTQEANSISIDAMKQLHTLPKNKYRDLLEELAVSLLSRTV
jgi:geranylgeranyl pyrophosphate synthase